MTSGKKMINNEIGKRIQKAREDAGLSQEELASLLGYTQSALSNYELGKRRLYLSNLEKIAEALNKPLTCFFGELHEVEPQHESKGKREETNDIVSEIIGLLPELLEEERRYLLEYIHWMIDRNK